MAILDEQSNYPIEANVPYTQIALKNGLILSAISIVFSLIIFMTGMMAKGFAGILGIGILSLIISIVIMTNAVKKHRDEDLGNAISFKRVFMLCLLMFVVSTIIGQIFSYFYTNFINPSVVQDTIEATRNMMEGFGADESVIDEAMAKAESDMKNPMSTLKNSLGGIIFGAIVSLIIAAIMKKERAAF